jgi:simple sugar transport system permease protein
MSESLSPTVAQPTPSVRVILWRLLQVLSTPLLAIVTAFVLGGVVIWITSGNFSTVVQAYDGLLRGALVKERGLSESLVATVPYILLSLAVAVGFKTGLFNIGVEGQFYIGAVSAAWAGQAVKGLPAIIHLPLALLAGAIGGAIWAAIPGFLKARTGAHEVITTIMMNYIAFRFDEFIVSGPLKDKVASAVQTPRVSAAAELWTLSSIPKRLEDPLNALFVALIMGFIALLIARWLANRPSGRKRFATPGQRRTVLWGTFVVVSLIALVGLPALTRVWWPFTDQYDRLHIGLFLAIGAAIFVWWLMQKTTLGFELRTVGANPNAARYAGINITRNIVSAMAISGALAGVAGTIEVLGVSICRCLPLFFSSGYGFDSIAVALLAKNNPFGILAGSFLWGAMRNGSDLMELSSGVSKYVISVIQALVLLFVAAPAVVRWIYRIKGGRPEEEAPLTRGWGG